MRVFSYIRVSGLGQVDKDGPVRQQETVRDYCAKHSLQIVHQFFEEGISGTVDAMDRPQFAEMLSKADMFKQTIAEAAPTVITDALNVEAIVVERMDRLARDLMVSEFLLAECRKRGLKIFCADQGELVDMATNEGDPTRVMLRQILGAIAQWEKSVTVKKLRAARLRKKAKGIKCEGKNAYGSKPGEKEILRDISDMLCVGKLKYAQIASYLNAKGFKTRHGRDWNKHSVCNVRTKRRVKKGILCVAQ
jgi:DNA invertase Pin-like site-specific DNA recombinase